MIARKRAALALALFPLALLLFAPGVAEAHAHLIRADLAPDSHIYVPGGSVHFWFDESLNPALSNIVIKDAQGRQVNTDTGQLDPTNSEELDVVVPAMAPGQYTVFWTSDSAQDGHILHGFYVFTAGGPGATAIGSTAGIVSGGNNPSLDSAAWAGALAHWLVLLASTGWTGALVLELLIFTPARRREDAHVVALANRASERALSVVQLGLLLTLVASVLEIAAQAYAGGSTIFDLDTVRDILHSSYGTYWVLRLACVFSAQLALLLVPVRAAAPEAAPSQLRAAPTSWPMVAAGLSGLVYLFALAMSGHAAAVPQLVVTSVTLDWLHLLSNTVWIGGMIGIALALVPALGTALHTDGTRGRGTRLAFLALLNRYSPLALIALPTAAVTGEFNAQVHLSSWDAFVTTEYGRFLIVKMALIAVIVAISASHVLYSRPRLAAMLAGARAGSPEARFPSLIGRLRLEPVLGAGVLLCVALMTQTAPPVSVFSSAAQAGLGLSPTSPAEGATTTAAPQSISTVAKQGVLDIGLTIDPAAIGQARLSITVHERGKAVSGDQGQVRVKLSVPGNSALGAVFVETTPSGAGYAGSGDLVLNGRWQADVLVRTRSDPLEYRDVPFQFIVGPGAGFLPSGLNPEAIQIAISPGRLDSTNTLTLSHLVAASVQLLSQSLDMDMGVESVPMLDLGHGSWTASGVYAPMEGRWGLTVQVQVAGSWTSVRQFVYQVPLSGPIRLLSGTKPAAAPVPSPAGQAAATTAAFKVAFAEKLPYTAIVTQMGSNGVRLLGKPLLHTGIQAHGVDVLDGTPYAYVTNFGDDPGTVSKVDLRTMKVVRQYDVGLGPAHIVFLPDRRHAFVTDFRSNDLYEIDLDSGATTRVTFPNDTCFEPHGIDLSENGRTIYVACGGGSWIYPVDAVTLTVGQPVITAPGAFGVAVDAPRHEVWVTNQTASSVSVIDEHTMRVLTTFPVGRGPALLAASPDGRTVYVADQQGNAVTVIDAASRKITATIPVGAQPHGLDVTGDGKYVYVASIGGNVVTIIRAVDDKVVAVVPSASGANEVAIAN